MFGVIGTLLVFNQFVGASFDYGVSRMGQDVSDEFSANPLDPHYMVTA